jgi:hypothetical protein
LKLGIAIAHEEMSVTARTIVIIIVAYGAPTTFSPIVVSIPVSIPSVAAVMPPPAPVIIIIS